MGIFFHRTPQRLDQLSTHGRVRKKKIFSPTRGKWGRPSTRDPNPTCTLANTTTATTGLLRNGGQRLIPKYNCTTAQLKPDTNRQRYKSQRQHTQSQTKSFTTKHWRCNLLRNWHSSGFVLHLQQTTPSFRKGEQRMKKTNAYYMIVNIGSVLIWTNDHCLEPNVMYQIPQWICCSPDWKNVDRYKSTQIFPILNPKGIRV